MAKTAVGHLQEGGPDRTEALLLPPRALHATREYLETLIEQHEAANEELQEAQERVQSANVRLRDTNVALAASQAGMESSNRELTTDNDALKDRNLELTRANNDFVNLLDSVQMAIVMVGPDMKIRRFTPAARQMLDLDDAAVGQPVGHLRLRIDLPDLERHVKEVMQSRSPREVEVQDKEARWLSVRIRPYLTLDHRFEGTVLVLVDIAALKRGEQAIRASADRLRIVQDLAPVGIFETDASGSLMQVNDRLCEISGRSRDELLHQRIASILHPDDVAATLAQFAGARPEAVRDRIEARVVSPTGSISWVEFAYARVPSHDDPPGLIIGTAQDITERKANEAALHETERRFQSLADSAPVLIWLHGLTGREFVNRAYREYVGATDAELIGWGWTDFIHPEDRGDYLELFRQAVGQNLAFQAQFRLRGADGNYRWMKSIALPRFDPRGALTGYVGSSFDVHDMKLAEGALRDADRRKNEFLAMLAHELRNPLAPLRNVIEMLRAPGLDPQNLSWAREVMARQVEAMSRMIEDLLDVSRITQGKIQLRLEPVDVVPLVRRVAESWRQNLQRRRQTLALVLPGEPLAALVDVVRIEQVLGNLLGNAVKFTPQGGHISIQAEAIGREWIALRVRDDGKGVATEELPRIFDLFMQADRSLDRAQGGLGIGLTLVKRLLELHGGEVSVRSDGVDRGTEFEIRLPQLAGSSAGLDGPAAAGQVVPERTGARRILVVDDNLDSAASWAVLLRMAGHEVEVAHDATSALAAAAKLQPEVALVDIGLPGMNGIDLGQLLRAAQNGDSLLLVAVSGYAAEEDRRRTSAAGFDHHFCKPLDPDRLFDLLRRLPN